LFAFSVIAAATVACSNDTEGTPVTPDLLAGLRYVNLVADTGAMDFRVIDIVENAPNQVAASFRAGGNPAGVTATTLPWYQGVEAGTRHIRVFMNGTTAAVASQVVFDTVVTFTAGQNYTFYLYGYARTGQTPAVNALITNDVVPTVAAGKIAVRVVNLAPSLAGAPVTPPATPIVDARVAAITSPMPLPSTGVVGANIGLTQTSLSYTALDTTSAPTASVPVPANAYRIAVTAAGSTSPALFQAFLPLGTRGSSSSNPIPGTAVVGTAITAIIVPRSVPGSPAPQTSAASVSTNIDSVVRIVDTVTVWRRITPGNGTTTCNTPVAAGAAAGDILHVSGLAQPEYNGAHAVALVTAGTSQTAYARRTITLTGVAGAFTLTFGGVTSAILPFDATAAAVEAALGAMSSIGAANVSVTGAAGGPFTVLFMGSFAGATVGTLSATGSGGLAVTVATGAVGCATAANPLRTIDTVTIGGTTVATDSFRVTVAGQTTPYMSITADSATIRGRIAALSSVGADSNVAVGGLPGGPYVVTFKGSLNNRNVAFSAALKGPTTATVTVGKAAFTFAGAATSSRFRYRIAGTPASPATGAASYKNITSATDFTVPNVLFIFDQLPPRTAP
jgi:hypothetical protein